MTQLEVIKKFMASLDKTKKKGEAALDEAVQACSTFKSFQALKNSIIRDCKNAESGDDFLKTYCGINLDNSDTGAITGFDAGGSTVKTASSVVPEDGSLVMLNSKTQFKINGLNVVLGKRTGSLRYSLNNVAERSFSSLSTQEKYLWRSIYTWWVKNGLDLITESYGDNYSFDENSSATTKTMYVIFENLGKNGMLAETWHGPYHERENTDNIVLRINTYYYGTASGKDGEVNTEQQLDRTIAHELTHAVMCANINYFDYLPAIIKEGFADLTQGVDDYRAKDIKKLSGSSATLSKALVLNEKSFTVAGVSNPTYAGGYMLLRYLARQAGDLTIENTSDSTAVKTFRGKDSITSSGKNVTVESGMGRDFIENNGSRVTIVGGTGNDTISNSGSKVLFKYSAGDGKDKVLGFNATSTLQIGDGTTDTYFTTKSGSNVIVTVGDGKVSLMGAANLSTINIKGKASTILTVNDSEKSTLTIGDEIKTVDASTRTKAIKITGNALNNSIVGGAGNDTLIGGAGNDSLWGNAGADTFIYASGDGKDIIYGFDNSDMLKITGTFSASYNKSKKEIYFKVDSTSKAITLKNFTAITFNVNGTAYKISGSKLK